MFKGYTALTQIFVVDEVVEDDPFRVVLSRDIEGTLIALPATSDELRKSLINAFLFFCRLPPIISGSQFKWNIDPYIQGNIVEADPSWITAQYLTKPLGDNESSPIIDVLRTPITNFQYSIEGDFCDRPWLSRQEIWADQFDGDNGQISYSWVRNTLKQIVEVYRVEEFAEYYLGFEWKNEPESIKKTAKVLLKKYSNSLRLYNAYALIEWSKGNKEAASGIFTAALQMSTSTDSILLWNSWIWASMEDSDHSSALQRLLSIPNGLSSLSLEVSPTVLIRAKQHLASNRDYLLSSGDAYHATLFSEEIALLEYLTSKSTKEPQSEKQGDIRSALSIFTSFSAILAQKKQAISQELLLQSAARLLIHHVSIGPFRPGFLREQLTEFLVIFPHNTIFMALYSWNESRLKIDRRVRGIFTSSNECWTSQIFKIRWVNTGSVEIDPEPASAICWGAEI